MKSDWGVAVVETGSGAPIKELTVEWDKEGLTKTRIDGVTVKMTGAMSPSLLTDIQLLYTCI